MVIEIFQIFKTVHNKNIPYCKFCLRTGIERNLVDPKYVTQFLKGLNLYDSFGIRNISICFVCEARAHTAVKFLYLVNFAKSIDTTFTMFRSRPLQNLLNNPTKGSEKRKDVTKALECNLQYTAVCQYSNLLTAETLIVDTSEVINENSGRKTADGGTKNKQNKKSNDQIETVCLDDDDEANQDGQQNSVQQNPVPPATVQELPTLVPLSELLQPPPNHGYIGTPILMTKANGSNFCLFATVDSPFGVEVPLLSAVIFNGQLVRKSDLILTVDYNRNVGGDRIVSKRNPALSTVVPSSIIAPSMIVPNALTAPNFIVPNTITAPGFIVPNALTAPNMIVPNAVTASCTVLPKAVTATSTLVPNAVTAPSTGKRSDTRRLRNKKAIESVRLKSNLIDASQLSKVLDLPEKVLNDNVECILGLHSTIIHIDEDSNECTGKKRKFTTEPIDRGKSGRASDVAPVDELVIEIEKTVAPIGVAEGSFVLNNHLPDFEVKKAVQKTNSRIDWEDKIPMDVISFVDTDTNADLLIEPAKNITKPKKKTTWHNPTPDPLVRTDSVSFENTFLNSIKNYNIITNNDTSMGLISNVVSMKDDPNILCLDD